MGLVPDHAPAAEHALAFLADQVSVAAAPESTELGSTLSVTIGAGAMTVTVTDCVAEPPGPVQTIPYSVVLERTPVDQVPVVVRAPCQPPEALHAVAFCEVQLKADTPPLATVAGVAANVTVGAEEVTMTCADWVAEPPCPVQVSV
jgi:hypothetical protein